MNKKTLRAAKGLFVDSEKSLPTEYKGFMIARNYHEAIKLLETWRFLTISISSELSNEIINWIEERKEKDLSIPKKIKIHSEDNFDEVMLNAILSTD